MRYVYPTPLLPVARAAERLGVSRWTAYRLIRDGSLQAVKVRSAIRVPETEIERYISDQLGVAFVRAPELLVAFSAEETKEIPGWVEAFKGRARVEPLTDGAEVLHLQPGGALELLS